MEKHLKGSFTVEAAGVMAVILFGIGTIITEAGRIHDHVSCAMTVHEAAEKARHEKTVDLEEIEAFFQKNKEKYVTHCTATYFSFPYIYCIPVTLYPASSTASRIFLSEISRS